MIWTWDINSTIKCDRLWDGALEKVFFSQALNNFWKTWAEVIIRVRWRWWSVLRFWKDQLVTPQTLSFRVFTWHQEKNKDKGEREGGSWFNPWDLSISPKLFTDSLSSQNGSYYSGNSSIGLPRSKCYITINGEMAERAEMAFAMNAVW